MLVGLIRHCGDPALGDWRHRFDSPPHPQEDRVVTDFLYDQLENMVSIFAVVVALFSAWIGIRMSRANKQADIQMEMHARFDRLQEVRTLLLTEAHEPSFAETEVYQLKVDIFFDRFWSLQYDQFIAWLHWHVPDQLYMMWMHARWKQIQDCRNGRVPPLWRLGSQDIHKAAQRVSERWRPTTQLRHLGKDHLMDFLLLLDALIWLDDFNQVQVVVARIAPLRRHPRTWPLRLHSGRVLQRLEARRKEPTASNPPEQEHGH